MTEHRHNAGIEEIGLLDYLEVIIRRKRFIFTTTAVAAIVSVAVAFALPKKYSATAKIFPPQRDQSLSAALMAQMSGGLANLAGGLLGGTPSDLYVGMLQSETVKDAIIDRFDLIRVYDEEYRVDTHKRLDDNVEITAGKKDGIVSITVEDKDPERAANMANAFVTEVEKLSVRLNISDAGQNRSFLETRLVTARRDLAAAEVALRNFQASNKSIDVTEQARAAITGIAGLKAQLAAQEVQLATLGRSLTESSQEVQNTKASIANLRSQIARLEGDGGGAIPAVGSVPGLGLEYIRRMREFKTQETLVELLTRQYEIAKLSEAKDTQPIQEIQVARPPDKKSKPKRALIVLVSVSFGFLASVLTAFVLEYFGRLSPDDRQRWEHLRRGLLLGRFSRT